MSKKKGTDYEVGYGKPPKSGQFKRGVSGNPSGRPMKNPDIGLGLKKELNSQLVITENGQRKKITKSGAIWKQMLNKAASGSVQAARLVFDENQLGCIDILFEEQGGTCECYCGLEADAAFAVSCGKSAELLELIEAAFNTFRSL